MQPAPEAAPFGSADLFAFLAETLNDAARRIASLEAHAVDMIKCPQSSPELLIVLQDFDVIRQMIEDAASISAAARNSPDLQRQHLAATLRLEALRQRLLQRADALQDKPGPHDKGGSGGVDLFDSETEAVAGAGRVIC